MYYTHSKGSHSKKYHYQLNQVGFTLIELMITVAMIAILAAIAIPSYHRYVIKNAESQAKAQMKTLAVELEKWRASGLSYRGFYPSRCSTSSMTNCYDANNNLLYVPQGSTSTSFRYKITLMDYTDTTLSLIPTVSTTNPNIAQPALGRGWAMTAEPNSSLTGAAKIYLDSRGVACSTANATLTAATIASSHNCGTTAVSNW